MTAAGEHFYPQGIVIEESITNIQRELSGQNLRLEGVLSVTTTDSLLHRLSPIFLDFQYKYPDVDLIILSGTRALDLIQRDADIALRPTLHPSEQWIGRNLVPIAYATYAHTEYLKKMEGKPPEHHRWNRLIDELEQSPMNRITRCLKAESSSLTITSALMGVFDLVRAGFGIGALPCYLGESSPGLIRINEPDEEFNSALWILAHPDLRRNAKVHALF